MSPRNLAILIAFTVSGLAGATSTLRMIAQRFGRVVIAGTESDARDPVGSPRILA